jgi:hypothetical protein
VTHPGKICHKKASTVVEARKGQVGSEEVEAGKLVVGGLCGVILGLRLRLRLRYGGR